jgi:hypothetical protein
MTIFRLLESNGTDFIPTKSKKIVSDKEAEKIIEEEEERVKRVEMIREKRDKNKAKQLAETKLRRGAANAIKDQGGNPMIVADASARQDRCCLYYNSVGGCNRADSECFRKHRTPFRNTEDWNKLSELFVGRRITPSKKFLEAK